MRPVPLPDRPSARRLLREIAAAAPAAGPRRADKPLLLYGAGNLGRMAKVLLERIGIPIEAVVDAQAETLAGTPFWQGTRMLAPHAADDALRRNGLLAVTIATLPWSGLESTLRGAGWCDVVPFYDLAEAYRDRHPLGNGWFAGALDERDVEETTHVLERWDDDISRAHHLQFIAWHCLREDWCFAQAPVTGEDRFFIPELRAILRAGERFADLGAHTGTVCRQFIAIAGGGFDSIWAIEPDPANLSALRSSLAELTPEQRTRIAVMRCALADTVGRTAFFPDLGYASQCSALGTASVATTTLDALRIDPSFIKLHLEGAELAALRGAQATLQRERPIVAATCYHNRDGIWEMPAWLMRVLDDYAFHLRLHSWCGTGAVVYGLPRERIARARR